METTTNSLFSLLLLSAFLFSCSGKEGTEEIVAENESKDTLVEQAETVEPDTGDLYTETPVERILAHFIEIIQQNNEEILFYPCGQSIKEIYFHKTGDQWFMTFLHGQDGTDHKALNIELVEETPDKKVIQVVLENLNYPDMDPEIHELIWNPLTQRASIEAIFEGSVFIAKSELNKFRSVREPCD